MTGGEAGMKEYIIRIDETQKDIMGGHPLLEPPKELVRCKNCVFWKDQGASVTWLPCMEIQTGSNWFCADGKRKQNG